MKLAEKISKLIKDLDKLTFNEVFENPQILDELNRLVIKIYDIRSVVNRRKK